MVTETQFNDALSRIFIRFDKTDEMIDRNYQQLRVSIDHVGSTLDEFIVEQRAINEDFRGVHEELRGMHEELRGMNAEMRDLNLKMNERITRLEDKTSHL